MPVLVVAVLLARDWVSAAIVAFTLPLIPLFMALVGADTRERMDAQVHSLQRLGGHFLDIVAGLPTLKVFGRATAQATAIATVSTAYRERALATLRIAFLSSLVLELLATVSMALVAVAIGLRVLSGSLGLETALFVLVLAPGGVPVAAPARRELPRGCRGSGGGEPDPRRAGGAGPRAREPHRHPRRADRGERVAVPPGQGRRRHRPQRVREVDAAAGAARARAR